MTATEKKYQKYAILNQELTIFDSDEDQQFLKLTIDDSENESKSDYSNIVFFYELAQSVKDESHGAAMDAFYKYLYEAVDLARASLKWRGPMRALITRLILAKEYDVLFDLVMREYKSEADNRLVLDCFELYRIAGDRALYIDNDTVAAVKMYNLATIQWVSMDSNRQLNVDHNDNMADDCWINLSHIISGNPLFSVSNILSELYNDARKAPIDELVVLSNRFFSELFRYKSFEALISDFETDAQRSVSALTKIREIIHEYCMRTFKNGSYYDWFRSVMFLLVDFRRLYGEKIAFFMYANESVDTKMNEWGTRAIGKYGSSRGRNILRLISLRTKGKENTRQLMKECYSACYYVEKIKETLQLKVPHSEYAYYTSLETFSYSLVSDEEEKSDKNDSDNVGRLSIMHLSYMNDPNEGKTIFRLIMKQDKGGVRRHKLTMPYVFVKCFTSKIDFLPMWEVYGDKSKGCCLVVDLDKSFISNDIPVYRVCYINSETNDIEIGKLGSSEHSDIKRYIEEVTKRCKGLSPEQIDEIVMPIEYLFKDSSYSYEEEVRIIDIQEDAMSQDICQLDPTMNSGCSKGTRNVEKPLLLCTYTKHPVVFKEIIFGPKAERLDKKMPYFQRKIHQMCHMTKTTVPNITASSIDYK